CRRCATQPRSSPAAAERVAPAGCTSSQAAHVVAVPEVRELRILRGIAWFDAGIGSRTGQRQRRIVQARGVMSFPATELFMTKIDPNVLATVNGGLTRASLQLAQINANLAASNQNQWAAFAAVLLASRIG